MEEWREYAKVFLKNKIYLLLLSLTALFSYGFLVTHQTIGIDDTPYAYYFEEGLNAIVGRWFLFLLNKIFHISDFSPFLTDLAGVLIFMGAVTVWAVLFYSIFKDRISIWGYLFFSCIFLSCPLISEVYPYYLHNGISIGYLCVGLSLCFYREMLEKRKLLLAFGCVALLWVALGCYESFMVVWLLGICLVLLSERYAGLKRKVFWSLCAGAGIALAAIVLRSVMIWAVTGIFGLGGMREEAVQRSVTEMAAWMFEPGALSEFAMVLKRIYVMYGVFAYAYYPIFVFLLAVLVLFLYGIYRSFRQKDVWIILLTLGGFLASFLLVIVEGKATLYRSAQFLPVVCGYGALLAAYAVRKAAFRRGIQAVVAFVLSVILWNQCYDMNKWFYVDYMKYESARDTMRQIAYELGKSFDISKPVVFTGTYQVPRSIIADAYVEYGSETFYRMNRLTGPIDEHLLEKFYREYGVWVAQTPSLSVIEWGRYAFDDDSELVRFFAMHGYELKPFTESNKYYDLEVYSLDLPRFPQEGSIVDVGDCIVVHF